MSITICMNEHICNDEKRRRSRSRHVKAAPEPEVDFSDGRDYVKGHDLTTSHWRVMCSD